MKTKESIELEVKGKYQGKIHCPSSKSYLQRAIAIGTTLNTKLIIQNTTECEDSNALINVAQTLGHRVIKEIDRVILIPKTSLEDTLEINFNESGLGIRMMAPILARHQTKFILKGRGSLLNRPMDLIEDGLKQLKVEIFSNNNRLPLSLQGPMYNGSIEIDGSLSSQFLSGLLIALPLLNGESQIKVNNLKSTPYIDMTLDIMQNFGVMVENDKYRYFKIRGNQQYQRNTYTVEGDWSSASFHLVAAAISGEITLTNLNIETKQADFSIVEAIKLAGGHVELTPKGVFVQKKRLDSFEFDATHSPDLFPALAILAVACKGTSIIKGIHRLFHKESNRANTIVTELSKLGVELYLLEDRDILVVKGGNLKGGNMNSNNDHRIAMMGAVASLIAEEPIHIEGYSCVQKSYPRFFLDFKNATEFDTSS